MSSSKSFASIILMVCSMGATAEAQNSSLLHAPYPRATVASLQPRPPLAGDRTATAGLSGIAAPTDVPVPAPQGDARDGSQAPYGQSPYSQPPYAQNPYSGYPAQVGDQYRPPVMLNNASWTHQPPPPLRTFQKNDVVTIRVDEITRVMAEGAAEQRKRTLYEAILTDWIRLQDFRLRPDPQANGDPTVTAESNSNYRAESTVESRESMTFNIAATVVDIRPNGMLVLEARKAIRVNDNLWETSLSGICRSQDIAPDNVVLSKDLLDLEIRKEDRGHLRDGYSRGWLTRFLDRYGPF